MCFDCSSSCLKKGFPDCLAPPSLATMVTTRKKEDDGHQKRRRGGQLVPTTSSMCFVDIEYLSIFSFKWEETATCSPADLGCQRWSSRASLTLASGPMMDTLTTYEAQRFFFSLSLLLELPYSSPPLKRIKSPAPFIFSPPNFIWGLIKRVSMGSMQRDLFRSKCCCIMTRIFFFFLAIWTMRERGINYLGGEIDVGFYYWIRSN